MISTTRIIAVSLVALCLSNPLSGAGEETDPEVTFDSESDSALYATVKGSWKSYEFGGKKMIRLNPEPVVESKVELGTPLSSYDVSVSAKILGKQKGRLRPRMGVGIFGEYGLTLRLAPGRDKLELVQYGEVIAESPFQWESAQWYFIELRMEPKKKYWRLTGRVWPSGESKPDQPLLEHHAFPSSMTHPLFGRAFLTGSPFNGLPILYDKVKVRKYSSD